MGLKAIKTAPEAVRRAGYPVFPPDHDADDVNAVDRAARSGILLYVGSIAFSSIRRKAESRSASNSRGTSSGVARASAAAGACILWLVTGALGDKAQCGEGNIRAQAFVAPTEKEGELAKADARNPTQRPDGAQAKAAQAPQSVLPEETASLREELDAVRSVAEASRIEQRQAIGQEKDRADMLARELDTARIDSYLVAVQAAEAEIKQRQALKQEREKADALAGQLSSLRAELDGARAAGPRTAAAEIKQRNALQGELEQERNRAEALARELALLHTQVDTARAASLEAVRVAEAAKREQELAFGKEHDRAESLAHELASARKEVRKEAGESSARLAAAHAEVLQVMETNKTSAGEQNLAPAGERERVDARPLLEHALERGSARAAFMLAETYDAWVLQSWRARGIASDLTRARELYERAQAGGIEDAKERIESLK
jgi:hypothetical protein